ncbi:MULTISPECIES: metallophosphoesterase family protein [Streptomyces]|uniref:Metallophosphoesterase n=2 Tax=Streptomyces TaxID=1883 RepID=A0ABU4K8I1_9ACTN|nr:metallophosphoesterase [Streptomyces roseolus]MDX2294063.1 metallophosphoesterase [Streptomyces roseolus]
MTLVEPDRTAPHSAVRVAAVGDIHLGEGCAGLLRPAFETLPDCADLLLLAGDLTRHGSVAEAEVVAGEVASLGVPVVAVLGNHDHHADEPDDVARVLRDAGVHVLEGDSVVLPVDGHKVGVAGVKGFCGGFVGRSAGEFGEPEMKAFVRTTRHSAERLAGALAELTEHGCAVRIALTHFSPVPDTLAGEPPEIYPFLGSYLLAEAIDAHGADLAVHGHAHLGTEHGMTAGGVRVRNVAQPVIDHAFALYRLPLDGHRPGASTASATPSDSVPLPDRYAHH